MPTEKCTKCFKVIHFGDWPYCPHGKGHGQTSTGNAVAIGTLTTPSSMSNKEAAYFEKVLNCTYIDTPVGRAKITQEYCPGMHDPATLEQQKRDYAKTFEAKQVDLPTFNPEEYSPKIREKARRRKK